MDIKKWNALLTAVEAGSFNKAAEQLGYTQSGLTYMMKSLEEETGVRLLHRSWDGIRLTEQGQQLLPAIRALCECASGLQLADRGAQRTAGTAHFNLHLSQHLPLLAAGYFDQLPEAPPGRGD